MGREPGVGEPGTEGGELGGNSMPYAVRRSYLRARRAVIRHRASAGRRLAVALAVAAAAAGIWAAWWAIAPPAVPAFLLIATGFNLVVGATEASWRLYGWRTPNAGEQIAWPDPVPRAGSSCPST